MLARLTPRQPTTRRQRSLPRFATTAVLGLLLLGAFAASAPGASRDSSVALQSMTAPANNSSGGSPNGTPTWGVTPSNSSNGFAVDLISTPNSGFAPFDAYLQATVCAGEFGEATASGCSTSAPANEGPYTLTICPLVGSCVVVRNWSGASAYTLSYRYTSGGTYNVSTTLTNTTGAVSSGWLLVEVQAPIFELLVSPSTGGAPLTVNLTGEILGGAAPYRMTICPAPSACVTNTSVNASGMWTISHTYLLVGTYSANATATDADGVVCSGAAAVRVSIAPPLAVQTHRESLPGRSLLTVGFRTQITGGSPPYTLQWWFGDGTVGSGLNGGVTSHTYAQTGTFYPTLTVRDGAGHATSLSLGPTIVSGVPSGASPSGTVPPFGGSLAWGTLTLLTASGVLLIAVAELRRSRARAAAAAHLVYHLTTDELDPDLLVRGR